MANPIDSPRTTEKSTATGVGAVVGAAAGGVAGGAAAGAAIGGMTGPVGAVVGAAVGAIAGAVAGRAAKADPVAEDAYWKGNYAGRPYVANGSDYNEYAPAYRYGVDSFSRNPDRRFDDMEGELGGGWGTARGDSSLEWDDAKHATRDAWQRLSDQAERATPGDSDRDGR